jgi:7-carboxy-7-deazaguanine synthase
MMKYVVNEIFYSLQGEGVRAGTPNIFIRFAGCNLKCTVENNGFDCDTEFDSGREMEVDEIRRECERLTSCKNIILTGGEPALTLERGNRDLTKELKSCGYHLAIETNGTIDVTDWDEIDWVTCSPKVAEHAIKCILAHEVKYVRGYGQAIPRTCVSAAHKLISPAFNGNTVDHGALQWCVDLVRNNPDWRLSVQQHKLWRVR